MQCFAKFLSLFKPQSLSWLTQLCAGMIVTVIGLVLRLQLFFYLLLLSVFVNM